MRILRSILVLGMLAVSSWAPASISLQQILPSDTMVQIRNKINSNSVVITTNASTGSVIWGSISGLVTNQADLTNYIWSAGFLTNESKWVAESNLYYLASNPFGFVSNNQSGVNLGSLTVGGNTVLTNEALWIAQSNTVLYADGHVLGNRSAWGTGVSVTNIDPSASGAVQAGQSSAGGGADLPVNTIGANAAGAEQRFKARTLFGGATVTNVISQLAYGAGQYGYTYSVAPFYSSMYIGTNCFGSMQRGLVLGGSMRMVDNYDADNPLSRNAVGCLQMGCVESNALMYIFGAKGAVQFGNLSGGATATNLGNGAMQLLNLTNSQLAVTTTNGSASLLLGAGTVSHKNAIVAGDGQISHGIGSITAGGGLYGDGSGITNITGVATSLSNTFLNAANQTNNVSFTPYVISFAMSNDISLVNGNYQYYRPTNTTTIYLPANNISQLCALRIDVYPGTNSFSFGTNNLCFTTNNSPGVGASTISIRTNETTGLIFDRAVSNTLWRVWSL